MSLPLAPQLPPLRAEPTGAVRIGDSRVLLEMVIGAFKDGATAETICHRYPTVSLAHAYATIAYYLANEDEVDKYLEEREAVAQTVRQRLQASQPDLDDMRRRLRGRRGA